MALYKTRLFPFRFLRVWRLDVNYRRSVRRARPFVIQKPEGGARLGFKMCARWLRSFPQCVYRCFTNGSDRRVFAEKQLRSNPPHFPRKPLRVLFVYLLSYHSNPSGTGNNTRYSGNEWIYGFFDSNISDALPNSTIYIYMYRNDRNNSRLFTFKQVQCLSRRKNLKKNCYIYIYLYLGRHIYSVYTFTYTRKYWKNFFFWFFLLERHWTCLNVNSRELFRSFLQITHFVLLQWLSQLKNKDDTRVENYKKYWKARNKKKMSSGDLFETNIRVCMR